MADYLQTLINLALFGVLGIAGYWVYSCYEKTGSTDPLTLISCGLSDMGKAITDTANVIMCQVLGYGCVETSHVITDLEKKEDIANKQKCDALVARDPRWSWNVMTENCERNVPKPNDPDTIFRSWDASTPEIFIDHCKKWISYNPNGVQLLEKSSATSGRTVGQPACAIRCQKGDDYNQDCFGRIAWRTTDGKIITTPLHHEPPL